MKKGISQKVRYWKGLAWVTKQNDQFQLKEIFPKENFGLGFAAAGSSEQAGAHYSHSLLFSINVLGFSSNFSFFPINFNI